MKRLVFLCLFSFFGVPNLYAREAVSALWERQKLALNYKMVSRSHWLSCPKSVKHIKSILYSLGAREIRADCSFSGRRYPNFKWNIEFSRLKQVEESTSVSTVPAQWQVSQNQHDGMCKFYNYVLGESRDLFPKEELETQGECSGEDGLVQWQNRVLVALDF